MLLTLTPVRASCVKDWPSNAGTGAAGAGREATAVSAPDLGGHGAGLIRDIGQKVTTDDPLPRALVGFDFRSGIQCRCE